MKKANCNRVGAIGFTLIELVVVVTIVAVITSVAIPMLLSIGAASKQSLKLAKGDGLKPLPH